MNYKAYDFGNHFNELCLDYDVKDPPFFTLKPEDLPTDNQMIEAIKVY